MMFHIFNFTIKVEKRNLIDICYSEIENKRIENEIEGLKDRYLYQASINPFLTK